MDSKVGVESSPSGASVRAWDGVLVSRDDYASFKNRKSRLLNIEIPAAAEAGVETSQIESLRDRTLLVSAPLPSVSRSGIEKPAKNLKSLHEAHSKLDFICGELLEVSWRVFYERARIEATQANLYAPRRQDIQNFRRRVDGIEDSAPGFVPHAVEAAGPEAKFSFPNLNQDEIWQEWMGLKMKLQGAVAAFQVKADQSDLLNHKSVRFSADVDIREFEAEADASTDDSENQSAISDSGIDLLDISESPFFASNSNSQSADDSQESFGVGSDIRTPNLSDSGFPDTVEHGPDIVEDVMLPLTAVGSNIDTQDHDLVPRAKIEGGGENMQLLQKLCSPDNSAVDSSLSKQPLANEPSSANLGSNAFAPDLLKQTECSPLHTTSSYPTPPRSSPLAPLAVTKAPLKSILDRKTRRSDINIDSEPQTKRRKTLVASLACPITPPAQGIESQPPTKPAKSPSREVSYEKKKKPFAKATMNQITRDAKARKDGKKRAPETFRGASDDGDERASLEDTGFFEESMESELFR